MFDARCIEAVFNVRTLHECSYNVCFDIVHIHCIDVSQPLVWVQSNACIITKTRLFKYIKISPPKNWKFSDKKTLIFFPISAQNIDCGYSLEPRGSNEYPQSRFLSRNKKNNIYPCKPQFYYIKWGLRGSKLYRRVFVMFRAANV